MNNDIIKTIELELAKDKPKTKFLKNGRVTLWVVFRVVAFYSQIEYDRSNTKLFRLKVLSVSNWWHNGSNMKVKKGGADDELVNFIYLCNEKLKELKADYRIPEDIFFTELPSTLDEVIARIKSNQPKQNSTFIEIGQSTGLEFNFGSKSKSKSENYAKCKEQLNHFLAEADSHYAVLFGASEQSVSQYLYSYANALDYSGILSTKSLNIIYFNVSKIANVADFIEKLTDKLEEEEDKLAESQSSLSEDKSYRLSQLLGRRDDGYILVLTGLNKSLMSNSVTQSLGRSLRDDDFCRLLVKLVNSTFNLDSSKLSKVILGVRDVITSVRAEFAEAKQIMLHPPTQFDWEMMLKEDNCPLSVEIGKTVPRIAITSTMIEILARIEKFVNKFGGLSENWQEDFIQLFVNAIENNRFGFELCRFLLELIEKVNKKFLLFLKCIALSDVGLTSSSMASIIGMLSKGVPVTEEELKTEYFTDAEVFMQDFSDLLTQYFYVYKKANKKVERKVFELDSGIRELLLEYWRLETPDVKHYHIHHAIACRGIEIACKYNSQHRRYQALTHIIRAVSSEYCFSNVGPYRLTLKRALARVKTLNGKIKSANESDKSGKELAEINRELVQIAWVYYFHQIEQQHENFKEEGIQTDNNWEYAFDKFKQSSAIANPIVKGAMLRSFASLGLVHHVNHFYLPEILVKSLRQRQLLDFLGAYSVNAYNRLDYPDLEKCVATYHQVFSKYAHESPEQSINLALHQNTVHLFARESMSRPTICHLRRLFDQGKVRRVRGFCNKYIKDINRLLDYALHTYLEVKTVIDSGNDDHYQMQIERKLLGKLTEFIRKLLKRRVRFEAILLKVFCQQAQWTRATELALNVYQMNQNVFEHLFKTKALQTHIDVQLYPELKVANPQFKNNRPLIHCMEYFVYFNIFRQARFGSDDLLIDEGFEKRVVKQGVINYLASIGEVGEKDESSLISVWYQMKRVIQQHVDDSRKNKPDPLYVEGNQKFDDNSILKLLRTQFDFANELEHETSIDWTKFNADKRRCIDRDLDPSSEQLSQQMKLELEVSLFKVEVYECQKSEERDVLRLFKRAEQMIHVLEDKGLTFWLVDMLLMYCSIIERYLNLNQKIIESTTDLDLKRRYQGFIAKRDKALINANQLIEKTHYHYRDLDLMAQQFPGKAVSMLPMYIR